MIWNDPKYALVIEALGPMGWKELHRGIRCTVEYRLKRWPDVGIWQRLTKTFGDKQKWVHDKNLTDFEAGCILAEFAVQWLARKGVAVNESNVGGYFVARFSLITRASGVLEPGGRFRSGRCETWYFTDRHEALAEGMLAFLREEGEL